jgi:hypothetical protein
MKQLFGGFFRTALSSYRIRNAADRPQTVARRQRNGSALRLSDDQLDEVMRLCQQRPLPQSSSASRFTLSAAIKSMPLSRNLA